MISYAQNCEDVILWRALKDVKNGFYVDVGANDPIIDSVTKWFYDQGWRGVNMEPAKYYFPKLKAMRSEDVNLCQGAGAKCGKLKFYEIPGTGLSSIETDVAAYHKNKWDIIEHEIDVVTLASVCERYASDKEIHFLKIDVEEAEKKVLEGMDFKCFRPWIVLIEVGFKTEVEWENLITDYGYVYTLCDGINRYYVAEEKYAELGASLSMPVCHLDVYENVHRFRARRWHEELVRRYGQMRDKE